MPPSDKNPPVLPDLNLSRLESNDFFSIPGILTPPVEPEYPSPPPRPPHAPKTIAKLEPSPLTTTTATTANDKPTTHGRNRSISKVMLASALEKAHMAVTLDNAGNFEGAVEAYLDACKLLGEVMGRAGGDNDRLKLQTIVRTLFTVSPCVRLFDADIDLRYRKIHIWRE